ncbi:MAG: ribosome maturation factor RimM [Nitriliruptorales bacterium]|nr:ribosome maturation factor RimM [Nitriliruptorales bacterium]
MSEEVVVGRIVKPHGIRGEVAVDVLSDVPGRFDAGAVFTDQRGRTYTVESARPHQGRMLVKFDEVPDRNEAERLRRVELLAPAVDYADHETYFAHEIVGMQVVVDGEGLGTVTDVIDLPTTAGYDLLEVERPDGSTWLLPAVDEYVEVDVADDGSEFLRLVDPPAGLIDPTEAAETGDER